jgi:cytidyltransferase-like protein
MIRGIVSGYFNPLHLGHLDYINAAKLQCEWLIVIVNNDEQVKLKGSIPFMDEDHRSVIVQNLKAVDEVQLSIDRTKTVCNTLCYLKGRYKNDELVFFNSGDRVNNAESAEISVCQEWGIKYVAIPLQKVYSSSELLAEVSK